VGPALALRGIVQPLVERSALKETARLAEAMRLAELEGAGAEEELLGVAARALEKTEHADA
jgi:hypothetical protein